MPDLPIPWGDGALDVPLPESWRVEQVASPSLKPAPEDWPERLSLALSQPVDSPPLGTMLKARTSGRVAVVVEDVTRHSPLPEILDVVLREVRHAGVDEGRVEIVFATGMHPPMSEAEQIAKLGPDAARLARRCNPWEDEQAYVSVAEGRRIEQGVADADLRILVSSVSPHLQAGFGGGYKMLLPGCASLETIRSLHRLGIGRTDRQLVGAAAEDNPMRRAIDAAGRAVDERHGASFAVQYLLDDEDRPAAVAAGDVVGAQRMIAKQCSVSCGILVSTPADVLIAGAHPRDFDLWQSFKAIANTRFAARRNGVIICLARCEAGLHGMNPPPWPLSPTWTRRMLGLLGPEALGSMVMRLAPRLAGDAAFFIRIAARTLHRNPLFLVSPALHDSGASFPGIELFAAPEDAVAAARRLLGEGPQRVVAFPSGGATYPIPSAAASTARNGGAE